MSLSGKRVLVTGANGGLGLPTCVGVLREGAELVLACRSDDKAAAARARAISQAGVPAERAAAAGGFDMLNPRAIEAAVAALSPEPLDVVFLQAGGWVFADSVQTVPAGGRDVEKTVFLNVVGAHATVRALARTGRLVDGCRIVLIGGEGARGVPGGIATPTFHEVDDFRRYLAGDWSGRDRYVPVDALGVSKLCAALWVKHLAARTDQVEVVWFTPGLIGGTGGTRGMPAWKETLFQRVAFPMLVALGYAQWPGTAAEKCVDCLAGRVGTHGALLGAPEGMAIGPLTEQTPMLPLFTDPDFQRAVWDLCVDVAGDLPILRHDAPSVAC